MNDVHKFDYGTYDWNTTVNHETHEATPPEAEAAPEAEATPEALIVRKQRQAIHLAKVQSLKTQDHSLLYMSGLVLGSVTAVAVLVSKCKQRKQRQSDDVYTQLL